MAEHEPLLAGRRLAVRALDDLAVGAADAEAERLDEQLALLRLGLGQLGQLGAVGLARMTVIARMRVPYPRS